MDLVEDKKMLAALEALIRADIPKYERRIKEDSKLMRAIGVVVGLFNDTFMTRYVTTIYPYVYFSRDRTVAANRVWKTLAHEWIHLRTAKRLGRVRAAVLYLWPQCMACLALLSVCAAWWGTGWLWHLLWLVCLAPIPAYFRAQEEFRAYAMSLAVERWRFGAVSDQSVERIAENFYGPDYYFMWPFKKLVFKRLRKELDAIEDEAYDYVEPFKSVKETIEGIWPNTQSSSV